MKGDNKKKKKNPLSHARGKQKRHENVWFRRSGAGTQLFIQYYSGQPIGTVSEEVLQSGEEADKKSSGIVVGAETEERTLVGEDKKRQQSAGQGQSRASKRRKRKNKSKNNNNNNSSNEDTTTTAGPSNNGNEASQASSSGKVDFSSEFPLVQELEKYLGRQQLKTTQKEKHDRIDTTTATTTLAHHHHMRPFLEAMSKPLPVTFRLRKRRLNAYSNWSSDDDDDSSVDDGEKKDDAVANIISKQHSSIVSTVAFGNKRIYQGAPGISKEALSKVSPSLKQFLIQHSQNGNLARQELGSMLPVLALEEAGYLKASSRVVDMCASPGSKTLQALEIIVGSGSDTKKKGRIVANDVLESRLKALEQAVERSGMPKSDIGRITYSCQDATKLQLPGDGKNKWDAVICDVPCSGDGTCRKDKHILPMWQPNHGNELHLTQLKILIRSLELVKVGGVVCYSTCSLNPVEDEAVVAAALRRMNKKDDDNNKDNINSLKQQPVTTELIEFPAFPGFTRRPGIKTWRVADFNEQTATAEEKSNDDDDDEEEDDGEVARLQWYDTFQDAIDRGMESPVASMWPTDDGSVDGMHLERCTRLWPHDHDTGGFFLALIRKNREV